MIYCKDCKYFLNSPTDNTTMQCTHPEINEIAPIARRDETKCGEQAIKFEPKGA